MAAKPVLTARPHIPQLHIMASVKEGMQEEGGRYVGTANQAAIATVPLQPKQ